METKFVVPFKAPQKVYRRREKSLFGVFDGARKFSYYGMFAVLKDGVVTLYQDKSNAEPKVVFSDLEDVFVTLNGYILLKKKGADEWRLYDSHMELYAMGEKAAVFQEDGYCLVFLKQKECSQWFFWNLYKDCFLPNTKILVADELDVRYDKFGPYSSRLMFIVTLDGKTSLQRMDTLYMKPTEILSSPCGYYLPNGYIVIADQPFSISEGVRSQLIMPSNGVLELYSADFKFKCCADGLAMVGKSVLFRYCDGQWTLFVGNNLLKNGIVDVQLYAGVAAYYHAIKARTLDGKPVKVWARQDEKIVFECGEERFFIIDDSISPVVVQADGMDDVFII